MTERQRAILEFLLNRLGELGGGRVAEPHHQRLPPRARDVELGHHLVGSRLEIRLADGSAMPLEAGVATRSRVAETRARAGSTPFPF